jgi:site-specific recombinase XerD
MNLPGFQEWLEQAGTSPHTRRAYLRLLKEFIAFIEGSGKDLAAVMADEHERTVVASDWCTYLKHIKLYAPISVNQALASLHTYCQFAGLATPQVKREDMPSLAPRALERNEQLRLLRAIEKLSGKSAARDKAIAYTLFYTGLRVAEVAGLNLADVIVSDRRGKVIVRKCKSDRLRETPLADTARKAMLAWLVARRELWGVPENLTSAPCFTNYQGGRLSTRSIDTLMDELGAVAKIESLTAHVLRHTFTTNLIRGGSDIVKVAELAGHARLETIRRYCLPSERNQKRSKKDQTPVGASPVIDDDLPVLIVKQTRPGRALGEV